MESESFSYIKIDIGDYLPYRPNGDIRKIIKGTEKSLLNKRKEKFGELPELQEQKNISLDAIRRIAERLFSGVLLLLLETQSKTNISEEVKEVLMNDKRLLFSLTNIIENIIKCEEYDFLIRTIDVGNDPEFPEWKPVLINLEIKSDSFKERLKIKHKIIKKAYDTLDEEMRKNIYVIGAI